MLIAWRNSALILVEFVCVCVFCTGVFVGRLCGRCAVFRCSLFQQQPATQQPTKQHRELKGMYRNTKTHLIRDTLLTIKTDATYYTKYITNKKLTTRIRHFCNASSQFRHHNFIKCNMKIDVKSAYNEIRNQLILIC